MFYLPFFGEIFDVQKSRTGRSSFFRSNCRNRFVVRTVCHCVLTAPKVNFFCPYFLCFFFSFFFFFFFSFHFFVWDYFYPKPLLFPRWGKLRTGHLEKMQTQVTEWVEDIDILCILKKNVWKFQGSIKEEVEFPRGAHEKLVEFPWILVFDLGISTKKGCHRIFQNLHWWKLIF